jgi:biotin operon repressor
MEMTEEAYLAHYGVLRRSGRYPWGSGGNQNKRNKAFLDTIADMRKEGMSATEIARVLSTPDHPFTTTMLRDLTAIARNEQKQTQINMAQRLQDKAMSNSAIGRKMGINESSVRALLDPGAPIGISSTKFNTAVAKLREEGYTYHQLYLPQAGTGNYTNAKVLAKPGVTRKEAFLNRHKIRQITEKSDDGGLTYDGGFQTPIAISPRRLAIRYAEDGGGQADGMIYVRPGIDDISLGGSNYAQVRVAVGDKHYLKGMAVYKDDLPVGVDLMFNTNKKDTGNKLEALKKQSDDPDIPFGAMVDQIKDSNGKVSSSMNKVNGEGDWDTWSRNLPTQMLSKQSPTLAKSQLDLTYDRRSKELDDITALTNPVVRKK